MKVRVTSLEGCILYQGDLENLEEVIPQFIGQPVVVEEFKDEQ